MLFSSLYGCQGPIPSLQEAMVEVENERAAPLVKCRELQVHD